jgi:hypothetical protein
MYEPKTKPLLPPEAFFRRLIRHGGVAAALILVSLLIGVVGYHVLADLNWIDALLNAAMILGGEGPVDRLTTDAAKIFASLYSLYSGLILLVSVGILAAPVLHRLLHRFHLQGGKNE